MKISIFGAESKNLIPKKNVIMEYF